MPFHRSLTQGALVSLLTAGDIGERNVFVPEALRRAAAYIEDEWGMMGYDVERLEYDVSAFAAPVLMAIHAVKRATRY
jgi:hypothetical protein